jgi:hypothetical protein
MALMGNGHFWLERKAVDHRFRLLPLFFELLFFSFSQRVWHSNVAQRTGSTLEVTVQIKVEVEVEVSRPLVLEGAFKALTAISSAP